MEMETRPRALAVEHTLEFVQGVLGDARRFGAHPIDVGAELASARVEASSTPTEDPQLAQRPHRLLEVGCGDGTLAVRLAAFGHEVLGIDPELPAAGRPAAGVELRRQSLAELDPAPDRPFDAVLFTRSLHHIPPQSAPLDRAAALLAPDGLLLLEEFDRDAADLATASWFYDVEALLTAAGLIDGAAAGAVADPLGHWRHEHEHDPPLEGGAAMLRAAESLFEPLATESPHYLYRHFCGRLPAGERGFRAAAALRDMEARLVRDGLIRPVGLRFVGRRRPAG